jgi:hypothetical protein
MKIEVKTEAIKTRYRLQIYADGTHIGEYETSNESEIARKILEIEAAIDILLETYNKHGKFKVDWDNKNRKKSIRINGVEVGEVPRSAWKKPSWE